MVKKRKICILIFTETAICLTSTTVRFKDHKYLGDPINAVKIFNEKEVDELIVLDIDASRKGKEPDYKLIGNLAVAMPEHAMFLGGSQPMEVTRVSHADLPRQ